MNYGEIKNCDIANGIGVRVTLFVSGCTNRCEGCFQKQTWDFNYGKPLRAKRKTKLSECSHPAISTDLRCSAANLSSRLISARCFPSLNGCAKPIRVRRSGRFGVYVRRTPRPFFFPPLGSHRRDFRTYRRACGRAIHEAQKDISLVFRGSRNQRIIDVPATRKSGKKSCFGTRIKQKR